MKLSKEERVELERLFVHHYTPEKGPNAGVPQRIITNNVTTNPTRISLGMLHRLARKGAITYEDNSGFRTVFGVRGWDVKPTEAGTAELLKV